MENQQPKTTHGTIIRFSTIQHARHLEPHHVIQLSCGLRYCTKFGRPTWIANYAPMTSWVGPSPIWWRMFGNFIDYVKYLCCSVLAQCHSNLFIFNNNNNNNNTDGMFKLRSYLKQIQHCSSSHTVFCFQVIQSLMKAFYTKFHIICWQGIQRWSMSKFMMQDGDSKMATVLNLVLQQTWQRIIFCQICNIKQQI